ncbi:MAG: hypothetical protein LBF00_00250 [Mycoplasmataceae bacterium]|nr:hypothetical protein [Mycoplasmataceae bacterium]
MKYSYSRVKSIFWKLSFVFLTGGTTFLSAGCSNEVKDIPSLITKINGIKIAFNSSNTPISNFCSPANDQNVIIDGASILKSDIKSIIFSNTYSKVTNIEKNWLNGFSSLTSIDFQGMSNVVSIGNNFLDTSFNVNTQLNFDGLSKVETIGLSFLHNCNFNSVDFSGLTSLQSIAPKSNNANFISYCDYWSTIDFNGLKLSEIPNSACLVFSSSEGSPDYVGCQIVDISKLTLTKIGSSFCESAPNLSKFIVGDYSFSNELMPDTTDCFDTIPSIGEIVANTENIAKTWIDNIPSFKGWKFTPQE